MTRPRTVTYTPRKEVWMRLRDPQQLATAMRDQGISQRELANLVGHRSKTHIADLLNGRKTTTSARTGILIEGILQVDPGSLFEGRASTIAHRTDPRQRQAA